ncbi:MAG: NAD(P)H-hydrate dehydratase [Cyclobacteriaceae bacterium]|nr:NAD(P)H-hydrate dehydratase [Cyclobacteriaceae bacterium]
MKILNTQQIRKADQYTIQHEPIPSIDLMERASLVFFQWFRSHFKNRKVYVFCGPGNNGGDGLAIARMLISDGWEVSVSVVGSEEIRTSDFRVNYHRLSELLEIKEIVSEEDVRFDFAPTDIAIDALYGSGLSRPVDGLCAVLIRYINNSARTIVSVDIPSGMFSDQPTVSDAVIRADHVVTFQTPKLAFMLPENGIYAKNWVALDIGISQEFIDGLESPYEYIEDVEIKNILRSRSRFAHKSDFGRVLLIVGSKGKMGAAVLSALACIRSGAGLVTTYIPNSGYEIMQATVPEVMVETDPGENHFTRCPETLIYNSVAIGPGLGTHSESSLAFADLLKKHQKPMVLDADAINLVSQDKELLKLLPPYSILTPHPGEFKRLAGNWNNDFERLEKQVALSTEFNIIVAVKGAHTSISAPNGKVYFNSSGNPGMATAGSGDVLTGIIGSLLGQGYQPVEAALLGVYLHGSAGDLAAYQLTQECLIASDIVNYLPKAYKKLKDL